MDKLKHYQWAIGKIVNETANSVAIDLIKELYRSYSHEYKGKIYNLPTYTGGASDWYKIKTIENVQRINYIIRNNINSFDVSDNLKNVYMDGVNFAYEKLSWTNIRTEPQFYQKYIDLAERNLKSAIAASFATAGRATFNALESITNQDSQKKINRKWKVGEREALAKLTYEYALGKGGTKQFASDLAQMIQNKNFELNKNIIRTVTGQFVEINGRNYELSSYCEMVANAHTAYLHSEAITNEYLQNGVEKVKISWHPNGCEPSLDYEGTVWSLNPNDNDYLGNCPGWGFIGGPPFQPNCSHTTIPIYVK